MDKAHHVLRQAEILRGQQQWAAADRLYADLAASDSDPSLHVATGAYFAERQNYSSALTHFMHALDGAQAQGDLELQAVIFGNLAAIYRELGELDQAQRFQRQVLAIQDSADASQLLDWSADALLAGKTALAEKLIYNAMDLAEDSADISAQADAWGLLGLIAARQAKPREAARLLIRAARGHHIQGDDHGLGVDFQNLAEVFGLIDRPEWQRLSFHAAHTCFTRVGRPASAQRTQVRLRDCDRLALYRCMQAEWN